MTTTSALACLALAIYHEARGESIEGQQAVGLVTVNRTLSDKYPNHICDVVFQDHQYTWVDQKKLNPNEQDAWNLSLQIARKLMKGKIPDITHGSLYFNEKSMGVRWDTDHKPIIIGNHIFY